KIPVRAARDDPECYASSVMLRSAFTLLLVASSCSGGDSTVAPAASTPQPSAGNAAGSGAQQQAGAAANGGNSSDIPPTFDTVKLVLGGGGGVMPCSAAPCHGVQGMAPPGRPLELPPSNDAQLYANLTNYVSAACDNTKLVKPGKPAQSALISILSGPCGMT